MIHRQDLCILESFDVNITQSGLPLYPYGNVQYGGTWSGIALADNLVAQGYSAYHVGDTVTKGKGFLPDLNNAEHVKFLQNKDNNCYSDNGDIIQRQFRIRTIAGLEGAWRLTEVKTTKSSGYGLRFRTSPSKFVRPQGIKTTPPSWGLEYTDAVYYNKTTALENSPTKDRADDSHYVVQWGSQETSNMVAHNGNCWAIPICLVQRRNKGAYHLTYNVAGSDTLTANVAQGGFNFDNGRKWYNSNTYQPVSLSDCFNVVSGSAEGVSGLGRIGTVSGRPDGKFYDVIYASDVDDLRKSALKKSAHDIHKEYKDRVSAGSTLRGREAQPFTKPLATYTLAYDTNYTNVRFQTALSGGNTRIQYNALSGDEPLSKLAAYDYVFIGGKKYTVIQIDPGNKEVTVLGVVDVSGYTLEGSASGWNVYSGGMPVLITYKVPYFQEEPTWTDIICTPSVFEATFPEGSAGQWIPQLTGPGTQVWNLNRKSIQAADVLNLASSDNGVNWGVSGYSSGSNTMNALKASGEPNIEIPDTYIYLLTYKTKGRFTSFTARDLNLTEKSEVTADTSAFTWNLGQSILGKVQTNVAHPAYGDFPWLQSVPAYGQRALDSSALFTHKHADIGSITGASPAIKYFSYVTNRFGNYHLDIEFNEMVWDGTNYGDEQVFYSIDSLSLRTNINGDAEMFGTATVETEYWSY
ncbi:hypothetical protein [Catenovulum sediminis]|uniref:hypothetical protein n=1 Tax=Catenovulum sediminis TaxID=1740262 RepID=UPI00117C628D|nr:hypothetical protein [Catenovulum sediminis]